MEFIVSQFHPEKGNPSPEICAIDFYAAYDDEIGEPVNLDMYSPRLNDDYATGSEWSHSYYLSGSLPAGRDQHYGYGDNTPHRNRIINLDRLFFSSEGRKHAENKFYKQLVDRLELEEKVGIQQQKDVETLQKHEKQLSDLIIAPTRLRFEDPSHHPFIQSFVNSYFLQKRVYYAQQILNNLQVLHNAHRECVHTQLYFANFKERYKNLVLKKHRENQLLLMLYDSCTKGVEITKKIPVNQDDVIAAYQRYLENLEEQIGLQDREWRELHEEYDSLAKKLNSEDYRTFTSFTTQADMAKTMAEIHEREHRNMSSGAPSEGACAGFSLGAIFAGLIAAPFTGGASLAICAPLAAGGMVATSTVAVTVPSEYRNSSFWKGFFIAGTAVQFLSEISNKRIAEKREQERLELEQKRLSRERAEVAQLEALKKITASKIKAPQFTDPIALSSNDHVRFFVSQNRPLFQNNGIGMVPTDKIKFLSINDIRSEKGVQELIYVVDNLGNLKIANRNYGFIQKIMHCDLCNARPVYAAGELVVSRGMIRKINNKSGHYRPNGNHLQAFVESKFKEAGFSEAGGLYQHFDKGCIAPDGDNQRMVTLGLGPS